MYERFERLLKEHGVTAYRVAKDTGMTTSSISNWKMGRYEPKARSIYKIAEYFGVPMEYFYKGE